MAGRARLCSDANKRCDPVDFAAIGVIIAFMRKDHYVYVLRCWDFLVFREEFHEGE
jgi:hypothetical protein